MDLDADLEIRLAPAFAHASEAELARILDFYAVAWEYEPQTFPILFDRSGTVLESFSPDFYLPELDLYVELTTLKQRLVRKKNRKLRRLRELYPGRPNQAPLCARLPGAALQVREAIACGHAHGRGRPDHAAEGAAPAPRRGGAAGRDDAGADRRWSRPRRPARG